MRSGYNNLRLQVYSTGTTLAADPLGDLVYAGNINFETVYPGGIFGGASFYIPKAVTDYMDIRGGGWSCATGRSWYTKARSHRMTAS